MVSHLDPGDLAADLGDLTGRLTMTDLICPLQTVLMRPREHRRSHHRQAGARELDGEVDALGQG